MLRLLPQVLCATLDTDPCADINELTAPSVLSMVGLVGSFPDKHHDVTVNLVIILVEFLLNHGSVPHKTKEVPLTQVDCAQRHILSQMVDGDLPVHGAV